MSNARRSGVQLVSVALAAIDWKQLLLGKQDWEFLLAVAVRTGVMFLVILVGLRLLGKRGVHQLSVFELGVIVGLGSAAGDPMFYRDVGLLSCLLVFAVIVALYHLLKYFVDKNDRLATAVEGRAREIIRGGQLVLETLDREPLSKPELFTQLRLRNVSQLGQIKLAILEPSGDVSVFYAPDQEIRYGLPILPEIEKHAVSDINAPGHYACTHCGYAAALRPERGKRCPTCSRCQWVRAVDERRIT